MMTRLFVLSRALAFLLCLSATASAASLSAYPAMPVDPRAIVVRATGDGVTDDSAALQAASSARVQSRPPTTGLVTVYCPEKSLEHRAKPPCPRPSMAARSRSSCTCEWDIEM